MGRTQSRSADNHHPSVGHLVVQSTAQEIEADLDPLLDWDTFERELGRDDPDRDHGPER